MRELVPFDDDSGGTVFRDVIMLALAGFVTVVLLLLPHINPPGTADGAVKSPGNVIVEIRWPDELDTDVDLWVQAPGDTPVGYSNKNGAVFNLLRDDLGHTADIAGLNYEFSYARGIAPGEYVVNVHLYSNQAGVYPVSVAAAVRIKRAGHESARQILSTTLDLERNGEEITVFRFKLDDGGNLVPGSVHDLPRPLRSRRTGGTA